MQESNPMKTKRLFSFTLSALLAALNCAWAGTLYVDAANGMDAPDYGYSSATPVKTIQRAIDMANPSGDTILVAPGTYAPFSVLSHSGIAIKSTDGAAVTIVDGEGKERCATFENAYTMTIEGFTLRNGHATNDSPGSDPSNGGGVCYATVKQCVIVDCVADSDGGGTYGCVIFDSSISDCTATGSGGGISGVILSGSGGTYHFNRAVDCTIFGNRASGDGGGVDSSDLIRCIVSNNVSAMLGGGALARGIVEDCTICCNKAFAGGGAFTWGGTFRNCDIYGNEAAATSEYWGNGMSYSMDCGGGGVCGSDFAGRSFATFYN
ncbi:MAG: hypothetical protein IJQ00_08200, partial [Kiritimatiellae bacterium]|nr:hypothetical protein [Kiritimatiellia bacterium]